MAKRTRYPTRTTTRPAAKPAPKPSTLATVQPIDYGTSTLPTSPDPDFGAADDMPVRSSGHLTDAELASAAALEAEATAKEKAAIAESLRRKQRTEAIGHETGDVNAPLSVRAAKEYAYVARDVRRIGITASFMVAILLVLHLLVNVFGVITL